MILETNPALIPSELTVFNKCILPLTALCGDSIRNWSSHQILTKTSTVASWLYVTFFFWLHKKKKKICLSFTSRYVTADQFLPFERV